ncbi:MAG: endonuclease/exonuclease/phosphatase family protein [Cyclobacteriaceae bacterium]
MKKEQVLYIPLILLLLLTIAQRIPSGVWWIRISDFPHVQITVLTALVVIAVILWAPGSQFKKVMVVLGIVGVGYQIYNIFPYTAMAPQAVEGSDDCPVSSVSILEANVYQKNRQYGKFIEQVRAYNPDIVIALETDQDWADTLRVSLNDYPYVMSEPLENTYGMMLFSRMPYSNEKVKYRIRDSIPSFILDLNMESQDVRMYVVHPRPPTLTDSDSSTQRDAELILVGREAQSDSLPAIVVGDMNDVAWSRTIRLFERLSGLLDLRKGRGMYNTYDATNFLLRYPLDHFFVSDDFLLKTIERVPKIGSDHFPLYVELCLKEQKGEAQNTEQEPADSEDVEEGTEKVKKAEQRENDNQ